MKAAWIRPGGPAVPDGAKAKCYGIDTLIWDATDPDIQTTKDSTGKDVFFFDKVRSWGFTPGFTYDPSWDNSDPIELATRMSAKVRALGTESLPCLCVADIEALWQRGSEYVENFLAAWRHLRPTRKTVWTTEPLQGGQVSDALAAQINADTNLLVAPQLYDAQMAPWPENTVVLEMGQNPNRRNIARQRIVSYYDAAHLPAAWNGLVFDFARLP